MQDLSKEWLEFLRDQFPAGSRVQTWELDDPVNTLKEAGTLNRIDDGGRFHVRQSDGGERILALGEDFFSVPARQFTAGVPFADMICAEADYTEALAAHVKDKGNFPPMNNDALMENYPGLYQSLLQIIHNTGERINRRTAERREK